MKNIAMLIILLISIIVASGSSHGQHAPLGEKTSYLGQTPPGLVPELFAPDIIQTKHREAAAAFSPDLSEFYFRRRGGEFQSNTLVVIRYENNQWRETVILPRAGEPFVSLDNSTLHLGRTYRKRTDSGWSDAILRDGPLKGIPIMRLTASANGTVYFDTADETPIRYSRLINGKREEPRSLGIDMGPWNAHPYIAPDESYVIWDDQRESGNGRADLYISFRGLDGNWGPSVSFGDTINTELSEAYGSVSPDGKYFFFHRSFGGDTGDIYWVDAKIIDNLRPK